MHRVANGDVEASEALDGIRYFQAPRAWRLGPRDTRACDGACQDHDQPWQAHLTPA
jgi:hypothetical protein